MILTLDFKKAHDTKGLRPFQSNILVIGPDQILIHAQWEGHRFVDHLLGMPIEDVREFAVIEHPAIPNPALTRLDF